RLSAARRKGSDSTDSDGDADRFSCGFVNLECDALTKCRKARRRGRRRERPRRARSPKHKKGVRAGSTNARDGRRILAALFGLLACFFPASNAGGHVLDIFVAELGGGTGGSLIGLALGIAAVGHNQGVLVLRQLGGEVALDGGIVESPGYVTRAVGLSAVDIDDRCLFGFAE